MKPVDGLTLPIRVCEPLAEAELAFDDGLTATAALRPTAAGRLDHIGHAKIGGRHTRSRQVYATLAATIGYRRWPNMTPRSLAFIPLCVALHACDKDPSPEQAAPSAQPTQAGNQAVESPAPEQQAAAPAPAPDDLHIEALQKDLGCSDKARGNACRILADFASAERWALDTPSGEARWFGNGYIREKGAEKRELLIVYAKTAPTAQVPPGALPVRISIALLPEELRPHGVTLATSLSLSNSPSKRNRAQPYVESFAPTDGQSAIQTAGASARLIGDQPTYLRKKEGSRRLYVVRLSSARTAASGDGTYGELWLTDW
jgi:hypothetical protein